MGKYCEGLALIKISYNLSNDFPVKDKLQ